MDSLPTELVELILLWDVRLCRCEKNTVLRLRLVCKAFDMALKPYVFKTVQLEFSRFLRHSPTPAIDSLVGVGRICQSVYVDMMVIRDEEEINQLSEVFREIMAKVPDMVPLVDSLRRFCMNETTFDETDFKRVLEGVLEATPNMTRLKLNLPFQVVGRTSTTATLLLATTLACVAQRPDEFERIQTLVLDHVSDTTINKICNNPMDLKNAWMIFAGLRNLVLSIKRQETRHMQQSAFSQNLWFLIRKATYLESLCVIGWNVKRDANLRRIGPSRSFDEWTTRSLPYVFEPAQGLQNLRYLELKRVDINPILLEQLIQENSYSLQEVYLNEVYMKVVGTSVHEKMALWIGHPDAAKPDDCFWFAQRLRTMKGLKLKVLRATGLGYDDFDPDLNSSHPNYDLVDPSGLNRSFDQRFVEAVLGIEPDKLGTPMAQTDSPIDVFGQLPIEPQSLTPRRHPSNAAPPPTSPESPALLKLLRDQNRIEYDAETFQLHHNTTSHFKRCIDGYFFNHNEQALKELQRIITVADRGMSLLAAEIERSRALRFPPAPI